MEKGKIMKIVVLKGSTYMNGTSNTLAKEKSIHVVIGIVD